MPMNENDIQTAYRRFARKITQQSDKQVFVVSGAPGCGKSTYVKKNATNRDIVLDLDELCNAIQGASGIHQDHKAVLSAALAARDAIYNEIENKTGEWERAFVITADPDDLKVTNLVRRFSAEHIKINASREECINRIMNDPSRKGEEERQIQIVDDWFNRQWFLNGDD